MTPDEWREHLQEFPEDVSDLISELDSYQKALELCREQRDNAIEEYLGSSVKKPSQLDVVNQVTKAAINYKNEELDQILKGEVSE